MAADRPRPEKHRTRDAARLTLREIRFCQHFFEHGNRVEAVQYAFPTPERNYMAAAQFGRYLLKKPQILAYVEQIRREACDAAQATANRVVQGLGRNAWADRRALYDKDGALLPAHEWPDDVAATVVEVHTVEVKDADGNVTGLLRKVKTERRTESLKALGEHTGVLGKDKAAGKAEASSAPRLVREVVPDDAG
jgi:phage terminase small subunit